MKRIVSSLFVIAAVVSLSRATEPAAFDLNSVGPAAVKAEGLIMPVSAELAAVALAKPEIPGPAKSEGADFLPKGLESKKDMPPKLQEEDKGFGGRVVLFEKGVGPMECYHATPSSLSQALSIKLCSGAIDTSPAECYKKTPSSLNAVRSVELCMGARNTSPADCYNATPRSLNMDLSVRLCRRASSASPAECYNKTPASLNATLSVQLCEGAGNTGPADCYNATPTSLNMELSVQLCMHASDTSPADCYKATPGLMSMADSVELCRVHCPLPYLAGPR